MVGPRVRSAMTGEDDGGAGGSLFEAFGLEKGGQQGAAEVGVNATLDRNLVVRLRVSENSGTLTDGAGLGIIGSEIQGIQSGPRNRARAHRAGLGRDE